MKFTFRDENGNIPKINDKEIWFEMDIKDYCKTIGIDFLFISNGYDMVIKSESNPNGLLVFNLENMYNLNQKLKDIKCSM